MYAHVHESKLGWQHDNIEYRNSFLIFLFNYDIENLFTLSRYRQQKVATVSWVGNSTEIKLAYMYNKPQGKLTGDIFRWTQQIKN